VVNALPAVLVNSGDLCLGNTFTINPSGASTYVFSNGSNTVTPVADDSYTVTGTDVNGCSAAAVANVTVHALPVVSVNSGSICSGTTFTIVPSGATSYVITGNSTTVSPLTTTSYSIVGTDNFGCVSMQAITEVTVVTSPVVTVNSGSVCSGDSFTLVPNGALTYVYSGGSDVVNSSRESKLHCNRNRC